MSYVYVFNFLMFEYNFFFSFVFLLKVGEVKVNNVDLKTEMVDVRGSSMETQECHVEDETGLIVLHLWDSQIGCLIAGHRYRIHNLKTREFDNSFFITTTPYSHFEELEPGPSPHGDFVVQRDPVITVIGQINAAEIAVSQRCTKCQIWQQAFNEKVHFHRCQNCIAAKKCQLPAGCFGTFCCG